MTRDIVNDSYFDWMFGLVCDEQYSKNVSYRKLLARLHSIEFTVLIEKDNNRAEDGFDLRYRFADENKIDDILFYIDGPCSVLEMLIALSVRCEESIMDDPVLGNRTGQWFWGMIVTLGLGSMIDSRFDRHYVDFVIERFLKREYKSNGDGGIFKIENPPKPLTEVEIWCQMCWYLDGFLQL